MPNIDRIRVDGTDYDLSTPQIYDNQERIIGTWFGEPIYRKVISLTTEEILALVKASDNRRLYPVDISIDYLLRADTIANYTIDNVVSKKCYSSSNLTYGAYSSNVHSLENNTFKLNIGDTVINNLTSPLNIILEYTKQTTQNEE